MKTVVSISLFFIVLHVLGQHPFYYKIDKTKGLPSDNIYDIFQDREGFMWFTSNAGICRFDGRKFVSYSNDNQTSRAGSNIQQDSYGRIWYCNFDGYLYYIKNDTLHNLPSQQGIGFVKYGIIKNLLFTLEKNTLIVYDLRTLQQIKHLPINTDKLIGTHCSNGKFYVYSDFLYEIDTSLKVKLISLPKDMRENFPASIFQNTTDGLLFMSKYTTFYFLYHQGVFSKHEIKGKISFLQNLSFDGKYNWVCTTKGVIKSEPLSSRINILQTYFDEFNISFVYRDRENHYWFSTISNGILLVTDLNNNFIPFHKKTNVIEFIDSQLYASTTDDKIFTRALGKEEIKEIYSGKTNHEVYFMALDSLNNKIYTTSSTFKILDLHGKILQENIIAIKDVQPIDNAYFAYAASGKCGILKISDNSGKWHEYFKNLEKFEDSNFLLGSVLNNIQGKSATFNPDNQTIYFATSSGLFAVTTKETKEITYQNKSLYFSKIRYWKGKTYGFATNEKLYTIDSQNHIEPFQIQNLINNEQIIKYKVSHQSFFLFTEASIYEYKPEEHKANKIIALNPEFEIKDITTFKNQVCLSTNRGFLLMNQKNTITSAPPQFIINSVLVNNLPCLPTSLSNLTYQQNNININFSVLSFIPNQKNKIYYKINEESWQQIEDETRNFVLTSLAPGAYTISFKTGFENTLSSETHLFLQIHKPFWQSIWFMAAIFAVSCLILFQIYRFQIEKIKKRNQLLLDKINLEKNLNQFKLKAIKSQMNPHFFYNALNTIQSYILSNDKKQAISYLSKFSSLTRTILEMTEKESISLSEEIKTLGLYLDIEQGRFDHDFTYEIQVEEDIDTDNTKIPSMLLQPYVENAIKHGLLHKQGEKKLLIQFEKTSENLRITIDDNGIGRKKSAELNSIKNKKHNSFATKATQNRIELLNQMNNQNISICFIDKSNNSLSAAGTTVVVIIPIN